MNGKIILGLMLLVALTQATAPPVSSASPITDSEAELEIVGDYTYEEILAMSDTGFEDFLVECTTALGTATCTDIQNSVPDCSFTLTIESDSAAATNEASADITANGLTLATLGSYTLYDDVCPTTTTTDEPATTTTDEPVGTSVVEFSISLVVGENDSLDDVIDVTEKTFAQKYDLPLDRVLVEVVDSSRRRLSTQNVELDVTIMDVTETVANTIVDDVTAEDFASEFVTEMESVAVDNAVDISIDDVSVPDAPVISESGETTTTTTTEEVKDDSGGSDNNTGLIIAVVVIVIVVVVVVSYIVWQMTKDEEIKADSDNKYTNTQMTSFSSSKGNNATPEDDETLEIYNPTPEVEVPVTRENEDGKKKKRSVAKTQSGRFGTVISTAEDGFESIGMIEYESGKRELRSDKSYQVLSEDGTEEPEENAPSTPGLESMGFIPTPTQTVWCPGCGQPYNSDSTGCPSCGLRQDISSLI